MALDCGFPLSQGPPHIQSARDINELLPRPSWGTAFARDAAQVAEQEAERAAIRAVDGGPPRLWTLADHQARDAYLRALQTARGWRCAICHPPSHLPPSAMVEVRT
jgi:hypothetical protein